MIDEVSMIGRKWRKIKTSE